MDENQPSPPRRKESPILRNLKSFLRTRFRSSFSLTSIFSLQVKCAPRSPPSTKPRPTAAKTEAGDEGDGGSAQAQAPIRHFSERFTRSGSKAETKLRTIFEPFEVELVNEEFEAANVQVAFGPGASSAQSLRSYGNNKGVNSEKSSGSASKASGREEDVLALPSTAIEDQTDACMIDATDAAIDASSVQKIKKEYKEPWDYQSSYYPTSLPQRKPNSGDPKESGEAANSVEYDENTVNSAAELGLLDQNEQKRMLLFQLPSLPLAKGGASEATTKGSTLEDLSRGFMGKMLVYKSGAVKLKLGETLYDVSPGSNVEFAEDVVAMDTAEKNCCVLGELEKRAIVTPDVDSIEL
ncbi:DNA-directed RNA polymerase III subunit rpc4-like [Senna tora]|uniref:DNA-directed RNA polymerase III subunit rpc4-like n=1 Tax=Senna tora TaxID=362788 RepID=A0A835CEZ3_9FABA|nr:DNA-directed RNA polymerase III subunit rpc4-like [Senna tora]